MAVPCNRLDENIGIFRPFVAGQKDEKNSLLYTDSQLLLLLLLLSEQRIFSILTL
jgi:hypothetical protein